MSISIHGFIGYQVLDADARLGSDHTGSYPALKSHPFFDGTDWERLPTSQAPKLVPYLPALHEHNEEQIWSDLDQVSGMFRSVVMTCTVRKNNGNW